MAELSEYCSKARDSGYEVLISAANTAFRNLFDPYCAEYRPSADRLDIVRLLIKIDIPILLLAQAFRWHWEKMERHDIAESCFDGLAFLVEDSMVAWN